MHAAVLALMLAAPAVAGPKFEVTLGPGVAAPPAGRLLVAMVPAGQHIDVTDTDAPGNPLLGVDVEKFDGPVVVDASALTYPNVKLTDVAAGRYTVQALFLHNRDINLPHAPGNLYSAETSIAFDPTKADVHRLVLTGTYAEHKPRDTATTKYVHLPSKLLTAFHGRPMVYRFSVSLPRDFADNPDKKYPLVVHIGGFGSRYTHAPRSDSRFVQIMLDGAGPYGDPYQVNSANNGPYGDALTQEVIPYVEKEFRCVGTPQTRFTTGGSTGGWVSLALQIFYPDVFNGCWSECPDSVDFSAYELIDIYADDNAYVNRYGFERASKRTIDGDTVFTVRHESRVERVLGRGGRWELGGRDWASWNATYGPRGKDGHPVPLWDGETGKIDKSVLDHWKKYDLRRVMTDNWRTLQPKLAGKVHVWVGDADDYFLNNAVHRLKSAAAGLSPAFDGQILIEMRKPHTSGWSSAYILDRMADRAGGR